MVISGDHLIGKQCFENNRRLCIKALVREKGSWEFGCIIYKIKDIFSLGCSKMDSEWNSWNLFQTSNFSYTHFYIHEVTQLSLRTHLFTRIWQRQAILHIIGYQLKEKGNRRAGSSSNPLLDGIFDKEKKSNIDDLVKWNGIRYFELLHFDAMPQIWYNEVSQITHCRTH